VEAMKKTKKSGKLTCGGSWWRSPVALRLRTEELSAVGQQFFFSASLCYSFFFVPSSSLILLLCFTVFFPLTMVLLSLVVLLVAIGRWFQAAIKKPIIAVVFPLCAEAPVSFFFFMIVAV
jgi:hypothetical protein